MDKKPPADGKKLAHYTLMEQIGQGGMGVVHKAWDNRLERVVALKLLPPDSISHGASQARLLREARIASALNHPNIATIYGLEQVDGQHIIAMEYVQGPTLGERLRSGPLELRETLDIGRSAHQRRGPPRHQTRQHHSDSARLP